MCCFMFAEDGVEHPLQRFQLLSVVWRPIVNNGLVINCDGFTANNQKIELKILISNVEDYLSLIYFLSHDDRKLNVYFYYFLLR